MQSRLKERYHSCLILKQDLTPLDQDLVRIHFNIHCNFDNARVNPQTQKFKSPQLTEPDENKQGHFPLEYMSPWSNYLHFLTQS